MKIPLLSFYKKMDPFSSARIVFGFLYINLLNGFWTSVYNKTYTRCMYGYRMDEKIKRNKKIFFFD